MIKKIISFFTVALISATAFAQEKGKASPPLRTAVKVVRDSQLVQTGYSSYPAKYISGAITSVPDVKIKNLLPQNIKSVLQGQVAGVQVTQANGAPVSDVTIRIRGIASVFAESEPLYIVDGVPVFSGPREFVEQGVGGNWGSSFNPLSDFNIADVASIEILKDAAATAIYGARGGNGVILITTKKGQRNKDDVSINFHQGITNVTNRLYGLNGPQYLQLLDESWKNANPGVSPLTPSPLPAVLGSTPAAARTLAEATNTDNMDQVLDMGNVQQFNVSASSGSDKTLFYVSGSYRDEEGVLKGNDLTRYTMRAKISNQITKKLNIGINTGLFFTEYSNIPVGYSPGGGFNAAQSNLPVFPLYNANGTYFNAITPGVYNLPGSNVAAFQNTKDFFNKEESSRFFLAANFTYNLGKDLNFSTDAAMEKFSNRRSTYLSKRMRYGALGSGVGREGYPTAYAAYEKYSNNLYNLHSTLSYKKVIGDHKFTGLVGFEYNYNENPEFFAEGEGFANDFVRDPASADFRNQITPLGFVANTAAFIGYFANVNYEFKGKYLAGITARTDGSSRYGANHKYVTSPAISAGWILSEEDVLKGSKFVNFLKLRASYGQIGNSGIGNYSSLERWNLNANSHYLLQAGIQLQSVGSPDLRPERQDQFDLGIDYTILNKRISGAIDFYNKTTKDMIVSYDLPLSAGATEAGLLVNAGSLRNRGVEFSVSSKNLTGKVLKWTTDLVISHNSNKILSLGGLLPEQLSYHKNILTQVGFPVGTYYLAQYAGVDPANGQELIYTRDTNGNKVAVPATSAAQIDAARVAQNDKPSAPKFFGGLNNSVSYKNFDLGVLMTFSYGNYLLDEGERDLSYLRGSNNLRETALNRWTVQQPDTDFPRLIYNDPIAGSNTTRFLHDASYLRVKNVTLGYSFKSLMKKVKFLKEARLFVSAQNLFTITKYKGWDPEAVGNYNSALNRNLNQGITYMDLPQVKTFAAGLNLNF